MFTRHVGLLGQTVFFNQDIKTFFRACNFSIFANCGQVNMRKRHTPLAFPEHFLQNLCTINCTEKSLSRQGRRKCYWLVRCQFFGEEARKHHIEPIGPIRLSVIALCYKAAGPNLSTFFFLQLYLDIGIWYAAVFPVATFASNQVNRQCLLLPHFCTKSI